MMNSNRKAPTGPFFSKQERWLGYLYILACICIVSAAAILRFNDLPLNSLWFDEAIAANNAKGSFSELIWNTRHRNSSPIGYPLILYVIQNWQSSTLSVRIVPAVSSVLTVTILARLLPCVGLGRRTALLAALLAALSANAIIHAQDAREYSIDALVAVILVVGLLAFLRENRRVLLCSGLFVSPLLQYNLVLFSAAILGTALIHLQGASSFRANTTGRQVLEKSRTISDLAWPLACLVAGCVATTLITLRFHWSSEGFASSTYLNPYYYLGEFHDVKSLVHFVGSRTWQLLGYHLAPNIPLAGSIAFGLLLIGITIKREADVIVTLFLFSLALAIWAALVKVYPLGDIRQSLYLGPVIFLAMARATVWILDLIPSDVLRTWIGLVGLALAIGGITYAGIEELQRADLYRDEQPVKEVLAIVDDQAQGDDLVFVSGGAAPAVQFHGKEDLNYYFGVFEDSFEDCFQDVRSLWIERQPGKLWLIGSHNPVCQGWYFLELLGEKIQVEQLFDHSATQLHVAVNPLSNTGEKSTAQASTQDPLLAVESLLQTQRKVYSDGYNIYLYNHKLIFVVSQCTQEDIFATVYFRALAKDSENSSVYGRFNMREYAFRIEEKCVAVYPLPQYDLAQIYMSQRYPGQGEVWDAEIYLTEEQ